MNLLAERDAEMLLQQQARRSKTLSNLKDRCYPWTCTIASGICTLVCVWVFFCVQSTRWREDADRNRVYRFRVSVDGSLFPAASIERSG